jgi:hypothetical protein
MLLGNYSLLNKNPHKLLSSLGNLNVGSYWQPSACRGLYTSEADGGRLQNANVPTGTEPPYVIMFAPKGGELSATTYIRGEGSISGSLTLGRVMEANLSGSGDLTASMSLITSLVAALSGSGTITASISTTLSLAANLAGSGDLAGSLKLLIPLAASLVGSGTISANLKGNLDMEAQIYVNQSEASVQQIVDAIWGALAADYNVSGTMGNKLNGAGSAGDPWTTDLSTYTTPGTAGVLMKKASKPKISL